MSDRWRAGLGPVMSGSAAVLLLALLCRPVFAQQDAFVSALNEARQVSRGGDLDATSRAFEKAASLAPTPTDRARAWFELGNFMDLRQQDEQARQAFDKLLALEPPTPWHAPTLDRVARLCQRAGRLEEAAKAYRRLAALPGLDPTAVQLALLGELGMLQQIGDLERATQAARAFLARFPDSPFTAQAANALVSLQLGKGDLPGALATARTEAKRPAGDAALLLRVAEQMQQQGKLADALRAAEEYLALRPDDEAGWAAAYAIHQAAGTTAGYEAQLVAAAQRGPGASPGTRPGARAGPGALRRLADFYAREQQPQKALAVLEQLAALMPTDANLLAEAGRVALSLGSAPKARDLFQRALAARPGDPRLLMELGEAHSRLGDRDKAVAAWREACHFDPQARDPQQVLGSARVLGQYLVAHGYQTEAVATYQAARAAVGDPTALAPELGEAYEGLLLIDKAVAEYLAAMRGHGPGEALAEMKLRLLAADEAAAPQMVAALEQAVKAGDAPAGALAALGLARLKAGDTARAEQAFAAIPDPAQRSFMLLRAAGDLEQQGDRKAARALYEAAERTPLGAGLAVQVRLRLAGLCREDGDWRRALEILDGLGPDLPSPALRAAALLARADLLALWAGDHRAAAELYLQVATEPVGQEARREAAWGLADCAFIAGRWEEATRAYRGLMGGAPAAVAEPPPPPPDNPFVPVPAVLLAADLRPARDRPMGNDYAAFQLAEIELRSGHIPAAKEQFSRLAAAQPQSRYAAGALGRVLLITTKLKGDSPCEGKYLQALCKVDRGEWEAALADLRLVSDLGPEEPLADEAALLAAQAVARFGSPQAAVEEYRRLVTRFPQSPLAPQALLQAARLTARLDGGRDDALRLFAAVREKFPGTPEAAQADLGVEEMGRK